ncbi:MAG: hypothetical protein WCV73_04650 [Patescibacteria group bacterium]|jgi:hypothetical protein
MLNSGQQTFLALLGERLKNSLEYDFNSLKEYQIEKKDDSFVLGKLFGHMDIISMIQQQAEADGLSLEEIGLDNFDPEKYIGERVDEIKGRIK